MFTTFVLTQFALLAGTLEIAEIQPVMERGLSYVAREGVKWKDERACASCHHVPMAVWTLKEAKANGFPINDDSLSALTNWMLSDGDPGKILPAPTAENTNLSLAALYASLASPVDGLPDDAKANAAKFEAYLVTKRAGDGSWIAPGGRLPILASSESVTILSRIALMRASVEGASDGAEDTRAWLAAQPASDESQVYSLRLLLAAREGASNAAMLPLIDALVARQNEDCGWSQSPDMASDAYATGQAIYALASARCGYRYPATARGMAFLVAAQREDGSWEMVSRPVEPGGAPSKNLDPITFMGSAWGMLGLIKASTLP